MIDIHGIKKSPHTHKLMQTHARVFEETYLYPKMNNMYAFYLQMVIGSIQFK